MNTLFSNALLALEPYAFYLLNDIGSVATDKSGNDRHGTYSGFSSETHGATEISPYLPAAPTFNPATATEVGLPFNTDITTGTVIFLAKPDDTASLTNGGFIVAHTTFHAESQAAFPFSVHVSASGSNDRYALRLSSGNNFSYDVQLTRDNPKDELVLVIASWSPSSSALEVKGVAPTTGAGVSLSSYSGNWKIGRAIEYAGGVGTGRFRGQISHVALYDKLLSSSEITAIKMAYEDTLAGLSPVAGSSVSGVVMIDGQPAARRVRAFSYESIVHSTRGDEVTESLTLGKAMSSPVDGSYSIELHQGYEGQVFVVAFDDLGQPFTPSAALTVGNRIQPTNFQGYVFECDGAGTLPTDEPAWINDTDESHVYGTASLRATPFYRPQVHGPIWPEVTEGEEPTWNPSLMTTYIWLDASDSESVTITSGAFESLADKSGNGNSPTQADSAKRPTVGSINGRQAMVFDGVDDRLARVMSGVNLTADFTVALVVQSAVNVTTGNYSGIYVLKTGDNSTFGRLTLVRATGSWHRLEAWINESSGAWAKGAINSYPSDAGRDPEILVMTRKSGVLSLRRNGVVVESVSTSQTPSAASFVEIGFLTYGSGTGYAGKIGELIHGAEETEKLEGYLAHRWSLFTSLPSDHPYRHAPPPL